MKRLSIITTLVAAFCAVTAWAQGPNNTGTYYQSANGKKGSALKTAMFNIIKNPSVVSYSGLYDAYVKTDTRPDGTVRDWYSDSTKYQHNVHNKGNYSEEGDMYNREHSMPQSWFSEASPMKSDIVHVLPTDGYVNNRRSSYPFGEVGNVTYKSYHGYSKLGSSKTAGYSGTVFEPNDEIKGDIARIYFYMVTCYEDRFTNWTKGTASQVLSSDKYQGLKSWCMDMMIQWSKQDPVDDVERARNNAVYEVQGNRNPFVDYPGLEDYVWGTKTEVAFSYDNYDDTGTDPQPATVAQPVFSPWGGTYTGMVNVSMMTTTQGATIFFTANGSEPTDQSTRYTGPIIIDETTTLKAVAIKDDTKSSITEATYVITTQDDDDPEQPEQPADCTISLNNTFFGVTYTSTVTSSNSEDFSGKQDGVSVVYALGSGNQRYTSDSQIRLYPGNTLTFSVSDGTLTEVEFTLAKTSSNSLQASAGTVDGLKWTGNGQSVVFTCSGSSGNLQMQSAAVKVAGGSTAVSTPVIYGTPAVVYYDLQGRRVTNPQKGLYIVNGHKVSIR